MSDKWIGQPGFRFKSDFERPSPDIIKALKDRMYQTDCLTGNVGDSLGKSAAMDPRIKSICPGQKIIGPALTVKVHPADILMVHKAMTFLQQGDVMVIDGGGFLSCALIGFLMVSAAIQLKTAGIVVDGAVRDVAAIKELGFPLFAAGISPNAPSKEGPGEINFPIHCGGQVVFPGDIIVADDDGVVVVKKELASECLLQLTAVIKRERERIEQIRSGITKRPGLDELMRSKGLE